MIVPAILAPLVTVAEADRLRAALVSLANLAQETLDLPVFDSPHPDADPLWTFAREVQRQALEALSGHAAAKGGA